MNVAWKKRRVLRLYEIFRRSDAMKFEIADWRFEVTWDGLLCQPIERGRAKAAKKSTARLEQRKDVSESNRQSIGLAVETQDFASLPFNKEARRKGLTK
jgi:hypothetical protein